MDYQKIEYVEENGIATISLNSPKNLNAIDGTLAAELTSAFKAADASEGVRAILLNSKARVFGGGGDLGTMYKGIKAGNTDFTSEVSGVIDVMKAMKQNKKPIVGAINGAAAGAGFPLALGCDYVVADTKASFIAAFVGVGLVPDTGGVYVMSKALGDAKARELAMTGRAVGAEEAKALGFVAEIVEPDALAEASLKAAGRFAKGPALAYAKMKELLWEANYSDFDSYGKDEVAAQIECMATEDFFARVIAFIEKK